MNCCVSGLDRHKYRCEKVGKMYTKTLEFIKNIALGKKNDPISRFRLFAVNGKKTVILGKNQVGMYWANRLKNMGIPVCGFCEYRHSADGEIAFDEVLREDYNVCICSIEFDGESKIAHELAANGNKYVDYTFIVNNRFEQHYNTEYIMENLDRYYEAYELLEDEDSGESFLALMKYRMTRNPLCLIKASYPQYFHPVVRPVPGDVVLEAGGYDGETAIEVAECMRDRGSVIVFEPNEKNMEMIQKNVAQSGLKSIRPVPLGLWNKEGKLSFHDDASASIVMDSGEGDISVTTIDNYVSKNKLAVDLIKLDIEGSEAEVLEGAVHTITFYQPKLQISVYHKANDLWELMLKIHDINPYYKFYLGHHTKSIGETVVYAIVS